MKHQPVLLKEVIQYLDPRPGENFVDATFGGGGHAKEILKKIIPGGRLLGIDWDLTAIKGSGLDTGSARLKESEPLTRSGIESRSFPRAQNNGEQTRKSAEDFRRVSASGPRDSALVVEWGNFAEIEKISAKYFPEGVDPVRSRARDGVASPKDRGAATSNGVDGVLFDFGFSSFHIDESGRGFSYLKDEPLDMRFSSANQIMATDVINGWPEKELERIFREYGEERNSKKIARAIAEARRQKKILTTGELARVLDRTHRSNRPYKTYGRIFQALRIAVNNELENIKQGLAGAWRILKPGGRLAAISFHSLEDRLVKIFFNEKKKTEGEGEILTKKPVTPSKEEVKNNPRSRSAKLRAIQKL